MFGVNYPHGHVMSWSCVLMWRQPPEKSCNVLPSWILFVVMCFHLFIFSETNIFFPFAHQLIVMMSDVYVNPYTESVTVILWINSKTAVKKELQI